MINANELRIGNKVKQAFATLTILELYTEKCLCTDFNRTNICTYKKLDPIPLTPEILEKCGFERVKPKDDDWWTHPMLSFMNGYYLPYNSWTSANCFEIKSDKFPEVVTHYTEAKHLHQLQNLFFCLTGTELNYRL